jgi:hypothetical protein
LAERTRAQSRLCGQLADVAPELEASVPARGL